MHRFTNHLFVFLVAVATISFAYCTDDIDPDDTNEPENLTVEVLSIDLETFEVVIQAAALNTVNYRLYIGDAENYEEENTTGLFIYTFPEAGNYDFSIRAYGASGRYIKDSRQVSITQGQDPDPVPLNRGYSTPLQYSGYTLVWNDEFSGTAVNEEFWSYDIGDGCPNNCGWGNNELEYYRAENASVGNDVLTIEARRESFGGKEYTSAKLKTSGKKSFQYGRIDIRALLPQGKGIWPALWMLGDNISSVGWPQCGEIDIMEMVGGDNTDNEVHGTLHWDNNGHIYTGDGYSLPDSIFADSYHVFSIIWDVSKISWLVNDHQFYSLAIDDLAMSEFHQDFWFIFNVAVGGNWPGSPNSSTVFPQQMKVDYVRVFQEE